MCLCGLLCSWNEGIRDMSHTPESLLSVELMPVPCRCPTLTTDPAVTAAVRQRKSQGKEGAIFFILDDQEPSQLIYSIDWDKPLLSCQRLPPPTLPTPRPTFVPSPTSSRAYTRFINNNPT